VADAFMSVNAHANAVNNAPDDSHFSL